MDALRLAGQQVREHVVTFGALDRGSVRRASVEAALHTLASHFRYVATGFALEVVTPGDGGEVRLLHRAPFPGAEVSDEFTLAVLVGRFRTGATSVPFAASEVRLTRPAPARPTRHERLLGAGGPPLGEVALRLGFSDQSAWNRAFKCWKGMAPTEWAARQQR